VEINMNRIKGVVDRTWTKNKSTKFGDKTIHYCDVDGITFETGFKKVFSEGEMIEVAVKHQYGVYQYQPGILAAQLPEATAAPANKGNFSKGNLSNKGQFPIDPKDGQMSIIRQSSMNRAVEVVRDMMDNELFLPKTEKEYLNKLLEVALIVTDFSSGQDIMKLALAKTAAKEAING
jgi:hypothetical protein